MASKTAKSDEASSSAIKEEVHERDPMTGTGKLLARVVSSNNSVAQRRQFSVKMDKKEYMVRGDINSNVLSALKSIQDISKSMMKNKNKVPYLIGEKRIEGCINLGMPLRCLPENSKIEMEFYNNKTKTIDEYRHDGTGEKDWILFYIHPLGHRSDTKAGKSQKIIKCTKLENQCYMCVFAPEGETIKDALCKDGRFLPLLEEGNWELMEGKKSLANNFEVDKKLDKKKFNVGLKKCQKATEDIGGLSAMASKTAKSHEASSSAIKEEVHEHDPISGTGKPLARVVSSKKSVAQRRQFRLKIDKKEYVVRGDINSNVLSALKSIQDISKRMMKNKNKVPYLIGEKGIEGYINFGMPLRCLPENSKIEMEFYNDKTKTIDEYRHDGTGEKDWILFYVHPLGHRSDTKAGKSQKIIKCTKLENQCYMCVFAPEGETIKDALCKDGRFLPLLEEGNWELMEGKKSLANHFEVDKKLDKKKFNVGLKKCQKATEDIGGSPEEQNILGMHDVPNTEQDPCTFQEGMTESQATPYSSEEQAPLDSNKIDLKNLPNTFKWWYSVFKEQHKTIKMFFREAQAKKKKFLAVCKKEFDKVTKNSSLIRTQRKLIDLSKSVGYIVWSTGSATCFVLCSRYILTCWHVVRDIIGEETVESQMAKKISNSAYVIFSYEDECPNVSHKFSLEPWLEIANRELDYAILKLHEGENIPEGLVHSNRVPPSNGLIYIIGHPDGKPKSLDPCSVIDMRRREGTCVSRLVQMGKYHDSNNSLHCVPIYDPRSFSGIINRPEKVTYDTNFFCGSSGSPVFDENAQLVALHAGCYLYGSEENKRSVIEFGVSIIFILSDIIINNKAWYFSEINPFLDTGHILKYDPCEAEVVMGPYADCPMKTEEYA